MRMIISRRLAGLSLLALLAVGTLGGCYGPGYGYGYGPRYAGYRHHPWGWRHGHWR
jgi:hypothetical protein